MVSPASQENFDAAARTRRLLALFANPQARAVAARVMLGDGLEAALEPVPRAKRARIVESLGAAGLTDAEGQFTDAVFRELLAANAPAKKTGIDRFVENGRIVQYPANLEERGEVLAWAAREVLAVGERVSEPELNERLERIHPDVAVLRRYLVDYRLVRREADGSAYFLA